MFFFLFSVLYYNRPCFRHSFPTRRSSDLAADEQVIPARLKNFLSAGVNRIPLLGNLVRFHYVRTQQRGGGKQQRSEEHTSELQSRGHLVCRLLLEKKKNINNK